MAELAEWYDRIQIIEAQELLHVQQIWDLYQPHWIQLLMHILCTGHSGCRTTACPHTRAAPYAERAGCLEPKLQRSGFNPPKQRILRQAILQSYWNKLRYFEWSPLTHYVDIVSDISSGSIHAIWIYVCVCMYVYLFIYIYICICVYDNIHTYIHYIHTYIITLHTYIYIHIYI